MSKKIKGGKIIASGGFGCIFKPVLKCENQPITEENKVTKLMIAKHATDEYNEIQKIKSILKIIPNYANYFLLNDIVLCKPDKLTNEDLLKFNSKCKALTKKGLYSKNINNSLDKLLALNIPDGGINMEKYIQENFVSSKLIQLNNSLIQLLIHGIVPMNKLNVFHCDIKDANMLVHVTNKMGENEKELTLRLIDWGLSIVHPTSRGIPRKLYRRPFQYNVPFSSVLFNKEFYKLYHEFLQVNVNPDYFQIREFITNYIFIWNNIRGLGHLSAINDIIKLLTIRELHSIPKSSIKENIIKYEFTNYYIVEYLSKILEKFTFNGEFQIIKYFNDVFLKNVDIWGFVMSYISVIERLDANFNTLNEFQMELMVKIKYIIIHFLYESPTQPINIDALVNELTNLNTLFEKMNIRSVSKKLVYLKKNKDNAKTHKKTKKRIIKNNNKSRKL